MAVAVRLPETETSPPAPQRHLVLVPRPGHKGLLNLTENMTMIGVLVFLGMALVYLHARILRVGYHVNELENQTVKTHNDINKVRSRIGRLAAAVTIEQLARAQGRKRVEPQEVDDLTRPPQTWRRPIAWSPSAGKPESAKGRRLTRAHTR